MGYIYNYYEGLHGDDLGIDGYAQSPGEYVIVCSSVLCPALVLKVHKMGKQVGVWAGENVNENERFYEMLDSFGVDFVISNNPEETPSMKKNQILEVAHA